MAYCGKFQFVCSPSNFNQVKSASTGAMLLRNIRPPSPPKTPPRKPAEKARRENPRLRSPRSRRDILRWLRPNGHLFFRESCFHASGNAARRFNPTKYRTPEQRRGSEVEGGRRFEVRRIFVGNSGPRLVLGVGCFRALCWKPKGHQHVWVGGGLDPFVGELKDTNIFLLGLV